MQSAISKKQKTNKTKQIHSTELHTTLSRYYYAIENWSTKTVTCWLVRCSNCSNQLWNRKNNRSSFFLFRLLLVWGHFSRSFFFFERLNIFDRAWLGSVTWLGVVPNANFAFSWAEKTCKRLKIFLTSRCIKVVERKIVSPFLLSLIVSHTMVANCCSKD